MRILTLAALLLAIAGRLFAQSAPVDGRPVRDSAPATQNGTSGISGSVRSADGVPLRRAEISLVSEAGLQRIATTDADGRYRFDGLPAGRLTLTAAKTGYVSLRYGQRRASE